MTCSYGRRWKAFIIFVCCVLLAATLAAILLWDRLIAIWINSTASPALTQLAEVISIMGIPTIYFVPAAVAFLYYGPEKKHRLNRNRALFVLLNSTSAGLWADMVKYLVGRSRPHLFLEHSIYGVHPLSNSWDFNSFPSDHAAVATAMAATFWVLAPTYWPTYLLLAVIVCGCRILVGAHYLSDVLAGSLIGILAMLAFRALFLQQGMELTTASVRTNRSHQWRGNSGSKE